MAVPVLFGVVKKDGKYDKDPEPRGTPVYGVQSSNDDGIIQKIVPGDVVCFKNAPAFEYDVLDVVGHWEKAKCKLRRIGVGAAAYEVSDVPSKSLKIVHFYSPAKGKK